MASIKHREKIMKSGYTVLIVLMLSVFIFSETGLCRDSRNIQSGKGKSNTESGRMLDFYKQRNLLSGKMWLGFSKEKVEQVSPSGEKLPVLQPLNAADEFFESIDRVGYYQDQNDMINNLHSSKKGDSSIK